MTSLVTDLLVNPVLRQARRFSLSRSSNPSEPDPTFRAAQTYLHSHEDGVISETEECSSLRDGPEESVSSRRSSHSSLLVRSHINVARAEEHCSQPEDTVLPTTSATLADNSRVSRSQTELSFVNGFNMSTPGLPPSPLMGGIVQDHSPLPEDDGMTLLRRRILAIQAKEIGHSEKAHLMHQLLIEGYTKSRSRDQYEQPLPPSSPGSLDKRTSPSHGPLESLKFWQNAPDDAEDAESFALTDKDLEPTFVPIDESTEPIIGDDDIESNDERLLGCEHYRRNVKLQCSTCNRWYTCRFCHDIVEDHNLIRKETQNMLCMLCGTAQKASQTCISCEALAARYYCDICKLWNDDPDKPCYHCNDCGICRIGRGIGKDFYHCKKCCACIAIATRSGHKCIERAIDCDCPICGDYMFTSPKPVCFMRCGHSIHRDCLDEHQKTSYKCPICNKSLANMESQFRNLDLSIQAQPMPTEFSGARAIVLCHDCSAKSSTIYHWLGLKCGVCQSYNTAQLQIIGLDAETLETDLVGRSTHVSGLTASGNPNMITTSAGVRDMRRRHSSTATDSAFVSAHISSFHPNRLARSVSPVPTPGRSLHASTVGGYFDLEEEEEDGDILGFWSRLPRSIASNDEEDDDDDTADSSDEMSSDGDNDADEGEESEDNDFELLGHR
ncbi:hypothetical protein F5B22DRAFT_645004 [Xylaria bambusicola]|uniref:uncharacterized protein n=1 Tax=Xylaria bambusicola TaxID=326684 RepID=UPI0020075200|nr:uncharacterized protein F5B22DRAFT_645004 [Xylaria bambusicola]KAI0518239.1 hypothetical protein F5B22DRAFT_645004 [Xylaria bambusicola]